MTYAQLKEGEKVDVKISKQARIINIKRKENRMHNIDKEQPIYYCGCKN